VSVNGVGHVTGLLMALRGLLQYPLGRGLGAGGNLTSVAQIVGVLPRSPSSSADAYLFHGSESDIGALTYQLGIIGLVAFVAWFVNRSKDLLDAYNGLRESFPRRGRLVLATLGACLGVVIASLFTEATYIPQVSGVIFMFGGLVVEYQLIVTVRWPVRTCLATAAPGSAINETDGRRSRALNRIPVA